MSKKRLNALENLEVEPSPEVWKRIEERLPLKKKRRWLIWIFPALLVLSGLWFYFSGSDTVAVYGNNENPTEENVAGHYSQKDVNRNEEFENNNKAILADKRNQKENTQSAGSFTKKSEKNSRIYKPSIASPALANVYTSGKSVSANADVSFSGLPGDNKDVIPAMTQLTFIPEVQSVSMDIKQGKENKERKSQLSKWSIYSSISYNYAHAITQEQGNENSGYAIKGLKDIGWNAGFSYDAGPRIQISAGVSVFTAGEEKRGISSVILKGSPGDPNNTYSIVSSSGNIAVSGQDFNIAYYESADSALFSPSATLVLTDGASKSVNIYMKQEFELLEFPFAVNYKFTQRKVTPFAGITLSPVFILKKKVFLEKSEIRYNYENAVANQFITIGLSAGVNLALSSRLGIFTSGFYKKGLSTIINNEHAKKSVYTGVTAGLTYRFSR